MTEIYESSYGIFNHFQNAKNPPSSKRPLATVAFHRGEDFTSGSLLEDTMKVFRDYPIKDIFGITYIEFMRLPVDIVEMMIRIAKDKREKEHRAAIQADNALASATKDERRNKVKIPNYIKKAATKHHQ